ncbi:hypothetical protein D9757_006703 [Collybiopsis confluens]|uniref:Uncharacterized protein n=1 Tax=Collybiopsis confluens TaxID=2823264 RepID=A0A8H5MA26_9AGAR|nr:hypothetical protein D9757_006703 [Collybiopsis confluens]
MTDQSQPQQSSNDAVAQPANLTGDFRPPKWGEFYSWQFTAKDIVNDKSNNTINNTSENTSENNPTSESQKDSLNK